MDFRPVIYVIGLLLIILAASMTLPMLIDIQIESPEWRVFFSCIIITLFFGGSMVLSTSGQSLNINIYQGFLLTVLSWIAIAAFGALPFYLSDLKLSATDAFFESMSGITTTGSTIITDLQSAPAGIIFWRAMLQWLGGIGFIVMAMSILPLLKVGGMRLFRMESSESEKALPRAAQLSQSISLVYISLTVICMLFYIMAGMNIFDALIHAMTTLSTGGFSTYDSSFAHFDSALLEMIAVIFMICGGLPFILFIKAMQGNATPLIKDTQVRWFLGVVLASTALLTLYLTTNGNMGLLRAIEHSLFNVVSVITTTGFVSNDYALWGKMAFSMFFMLTFMGACAGSTSGGIKIFRSQVLFAVSKVQIRKLLHPNGVFIPHYNQKPIPSDVPISVMSFFFMYMVIFALGVISLSYIGLVFITAFSGTATAISNVGPGLGDTIGPTGTFAPLPDSAKWILSFLMLIGRLEIFPIIVMLSPYFWRR